MPREYLDIFIDSSLPTPEAVLGEEEDLEEPVDAPTLDQLREDPDVKAVLAAAASLAV